MGKKTIIAVFSIIFSLGVLISGCTNEDGPEKGGQGSSVIDHITVAMITRAGEEDPGTSGSGEDDETETPKDDSELTDDDIKELLQMPYTLKFDRNSVIFVSQQTERVAPFQNEDGIYSYKFIEDNEADWEDGYNFTPLDMNDPLEWFKIGNGGSFRGGFALYALYFPGRDEISRKEENNKIIYSVEPDQTTLENLIKSDILGAYHSNPTLFTRLRFNLFHLMTYLRIRLYVPVYDAETKTGYYDDALISANLDNTSTDFTIEWSTIRSSDTEGPAISPLAREGTILMYQHPLGDDNNRETMLIRYEDFIPKDYFEQPIEGDYDNVRVYDFSVIMPMQLGTKDADGKDMSYTQTNFLNFILRSNSGAENKYIFNQALTANSTGSNLQLTQGVFQYLELYVPRVGNKVIYVNGNMKPWLNHTTNVPLHSEEEESDGETE
ncbi:MAG: hypothetical protein J1F38_02405 [Muribaculaceae bacterium]|nr:hypothetical protein [Muribaculaceae bacterium]